MALRKRVSLNLSECVVGRSWCIWTCVSVAEAPLFSQDRRHNMEESLSSSASFQTPPDLVVDHWTSDVESSSPLDFRLLHAMWTPFGCLMSYKIRPIIYQWLVILPLNPGESGLSYALITQLSLN